MSVRSCVLIVILFCFLVIGELHAAPTSYVSNGSSTDWATSTAWTPNGVPDIDQFPNDDVTINHDMTYTGSLTARSSSGARDLITVNTGATLTVTGGLTVNSGDVEVNSGGTIAVTGTLTMANAGVVINNSGGTITANAVNYSSGSNSITNSGTMTIATTWTQGSDGSFTSTGTFSAGGNFSVSNGGDVDFEGTNTIGGTLDANGAGTDFDLNDGFLEVTGDVTFDGDGNITIAGDMDALADVDITGSGGASISLTGTLDVTAGTLTITNNGFVDGTGVVGWGTLSANPSCSDAVITCSGTATSLDNNTGGGCAGTYGDPPGTPLDLNSCLVGSLPIELLSFSVRNYGDYDEVYWTTGMELNNDYFELLGSTNGIDWYVVNVVQGAGNSSDVLQYRQKVQLGFKYFKLRQTDYDGTAVESKIIRIAKELIIKPTVFNYSNGVIIEGGVNEVLEVYDLQGRIVEKRMINHNYEVINSSLLKSGVHLMRVGNYCYRIVVK